MPKLYVLQMVKKQPLIRAILKGDTDAAVRKWDFKNKHSDACIYLPLYKLDVLKIVEYKFSYEMEAHVVVTTSKRHFNV